MSLIVAGLVRLYLSNSYLTFELITLKYCFFERMVGFTDYLRLFGRGHGCLSCTVTIVQVFDWLEALSGLCQCGCMLRGRCVGSAVTFSCHVIWISCRP